MIPPKKHPKWRELVKGEIKPNFKVFSGNMIVSRLSKAIRLDDSNENIQRCVDDAYNFFSKFENLFGDELTAIFR